MVLALFLKTQILDELCLRLLRNAFDPEAHFALRFEPARDEGIPFLDPLTKAFLVFGAESINLVLEEGDVGFLTKHEFGVPRECSFGIGFLRGELLDLLPQPRPVTVHDIVRTMTIEEESRGLVIGDL